MSNKPTTLKPTRLTAGVYTLGAFGINKTHIGWVTCDADDVWTGAGAHDVFDTLGDAVDAITTWPAYTGNDCDWL